MVAELTVDLEDIVLFGDCNSHLSEIANQKKCSSFLQKSLFKFFLINLVDLPGNFCLQKQNCFDALWDTYCLDLSLLPVSFVENILIQFLKLDVGARRHLQPEAEDARV